METKSSSQRRIPISRGGERVIQITKPDPPENQEEVPAVFTEMQRNMEDELERRRKDWERDVERMQQDFFHLKSPTSTTTQALSDEEFDNVNRNVAIKLSSSPARSSPSTSIIEMSNNSRSNVIDRPDGSRLYRLRFDVAGFDPNEVKVKAEGQKLFVSAWKEVDHGNGHKSTKQFNRQVDIPENVDPDALVATVNDDGFLNIEGPLEEASQQHRSIRGVSTPSPLCSPEPQQLLSPPQYYSVVRSSSGRHSPAIPVSPLAVPHSPIGGGSIITGSTYIAPHSPRIERISSRNGRNGSSSAITITGGGGGTMVGSPRYGVGGSGGGPMVVAVNDVRKLKMAVDVGPEFDAGDVLVKVIGQKIQVNARHEETSGGRMSKREFSREFDLPERLEEATVRAVLAADGRLVIGASVLSNLTHSEAIDSVLRDMPIDGTPVRVTVI